MSAPATRVITPDKALRHLLDGNNRFVEGTSVAPRRSPAEFKALAEAQYPLAVVVACADSRVAPEILFDVGIGDIFSVRLAGNVIGGAGATLKGSIEYAVAELDVPLIVVMGHSNCGAVKAALKQGHAEDSLPGAIDDLVGLLDEAVVRSKAAGGDLLNTAIRENVSIGVQRLRVLEPIIAPRVREGGLKVVGAFYELSSGKVTVLE